MSDTTAANLFRLTVTGSEPCLEVSQLLSNSTGELKLLASAMGNMTSFSLFELIGVAMSIIRARGIAIDGLSSEVIRDFILQEVVSGLDAMEQQYTTMDGLLEHAATSSS